MRCIHSLLYHIMAFSRASCNFFLLLYPIGIGRSRWRASSRRRRSTATSLPLDSNMMSKGRRASAQTFSQKRINSIGLIKSAWALRRGACSFVTVRSRPVSPFFFLHRRLKIGGGRRVVDFRHDVFGPGLQGGMERGAHGHSFRVQAEVVQVVKNDGAAGGLVDTQGIGYGIRGRHRSQQPAAAAFLRAVLGSGG